MNEKANKVYAVAKEAGLEALLEMHIGDLEAFAEDINVDDENEIIVRIFDLV